VFRMLIPVDKSTRAHASDEAESRAISLSIRSIEQASRHNPGRGTHFR
jgi:hypothetical protein